MPFHRFEDLESVRLTPHLSSAESPVIEGEYLYYCLNQKVAGTGSELHYHPNELLIFVLSGKVNGVIGKDRRVVTPGTFILVPPNVRHSMKATEEGPCAYLYIKDQTWSVVGLGADEALPDKPMTVEEVNAKFDAGELTDRKGTGVDVKVGKSENGIIIDGVPDCFYEILPSLDAPYQAGTQVRWIEGARSSFGFFELPNGFSQSSQSADHEYYFYVVDGEVDARVNNNSMVSSKGQIIEIPKGADYQLTVADDKPTRLAAVRSNDFLESKIKVS